MDEVRPRRAEEEDAAGRLLGRARAARSGSASPAIERICSGIPSCTVWPPISIVFSASLAAVRRVSIQPNATALTLILNWPHSLASVLVRPDDRGLAGRVVGLAGVAHRARDRGHVDDLAEDLATLLALGLGRLAQVRRGGADDPERHDRVDVEHPLVRVVGHLVDRRVDRVAGVVDDDVDLAPGVDRRLDQRVGRARPRSGRRRRPPSRPRSRTPPARRGRRRGR